MSEQEMIARALFQRFKERAAKRYPLQIRGDYALDHWENLPTSFSQDFLDDAAAILSTLASRTPEGMVMVPREPTPQMLGCGWVAVPTVATTDDLERIWTAMLSASPNPIRCRMTDLTELAKRVEAATDLTDALVSEAVEATGATLPTDPSWHAIGNLLVPPHCYYEGGYHAGRHWSCVTSRINYRDFASKGPDKRCTLIAAALRARAAMGEG